MQPRSSPHITHMKTRIVSLFIVIASLTTVTVMYGNQAMTFVSNATKAQMYQTFLQPEVGAYYSVQSITKKNNIIFVIGQKAKPQVGGKVDSEGPLLTIEVPPAKGTGAMKGQFLTVANVNGVVTTQYFNDERSVVQHALDH